MGVSARAEACDDAPGGRPTPVLPSHAGDGDDAPLIEAAIAGDRAAFAALYDRYVDRVYRACYYRTSNRADAEDLTQQTFLHAWQAIGRFRRGSAPFVGWLLTISQRLAISQYRRTREVVAFDADLDAADDWADPAAVLAESLTRDSVRRAILRLKLERQQVIILRFIEGFSVGEVAAVLGKTDNNVRVIQHRALADLRRLLSRPLPDQLGGDGLLTALRQAVADVVGKLSAVSHLLV